jgi:dUTP pyrophosphatase
MMPSHDMPETIQILRLSEEAVLPRRAHADDAGLDLSAIEDRELLPQKGVAVRTGIAIALPTGFVGMLADRSSMAKRGLKTAGGIIDAGYRGEIQVVLWNISGEAQFVRRGERIAQLLILPIATPAVKEVTSLDETARGGKGLGSSGR